MFTSCINTDKWCDKMHKKQTKTKFSHGINRRNKISTKWTHLLAIAWNWNDSKYRKKERTKEMENKINKKYLHVAAEEKELIIAKNQQQ